MAKTEETTSEIKNITGLFYLIGAVLGGLTGGYMKESFGGTMLGVLLGLVFALVFTTLLLKQKPHDR